MIKKNFFFYINSHVLCEQISLFLPSQFFSPHSSFSLSPSLSFPSPPFFPLSLSLFIVLEYLILYLIGTSGKGLSFSLFSMTSAVGLSRVSFLILKYVFSMSVSREFYHKWVLNFVRSFFFFCIYWDDRVVFILQFVNMVFSSVQSLSRVWLFATPGTAACQASLSITNSQSLLKLMSI